MNKKHYGHMIRMVAMCLLEIWCQVVMTVPVYAETPTLAAESALLMDAKTGQILMDKESDTPREIASTTKMIVQYIVLSEIQAGRLGWDDQVSISDYAMRLTIDPLLSNLPLTQEDTFTVEELFMGMSIASANAMTVALAEHIAGSESAFVAQMSELVASWGIEDAQLVNSTGLNGADMSVQGATQDNENRMSARSLATIAQHLVNDFPEVLTITALSQYTYRSGTSLETQVKSYNAMLPGFPYAYPDVVGLKTGTTKRAGGSFVGYVDTADQQLISVVLHSGDGLIDKYSRFLDTAALFDYGLYELDYVTVDGATLKDALLSDYPVSYGTIDTVDLNVQGSQALYVEATEGAEPYTITYDMHPERLDAHGRLLPEFSTGDVIGVATIHPSGTVNDVFLDGRKDPYTLPIMPTQSSHKAGVFRKVKLIIQEWLTPVSADRTNR